MAKKKMEITGKVTEVRVLKENYVIVFVKVGSPENIQDKIVRFCIAVCNDASDFAETDWAELAVGDLVHITRIYDSKADLNVYSHHVVQSEVLNADDL